MSYSIRGGELFLFGLFCVLAGMQVVNLVDHLGTGRLPWLFALSAAIAFGGAAAVVRVIRARRAGDRAA